MIVTKLRRHNSKLIPLLQMAYNIWNANYFCGIDYPNFNFPIMILHFCYESFFNVAQNLRLKNYLVKILI